MEAPPTLPIREGGSGHYQTTGEVPIPSIDNLETRVAISLATPGKARLKTTGQPASMDIEKAIEELKVSLLKCKV